MPANNRPKEPSYLVRHILSDIMSEVILVLQTTVDQILVKVFSVHVLSKLVIVQLQVEKIILPTSNCSTTDHNTCIHLTLR